MNWFTIDFSCVVTVVDAIALGDAVGDAVEAIFLISVRTTFCRRKVLLANFTSLVMIPSVRNSWFVPQAARNEGDAPLTSTQT